MSEETSAKVSLTDIPVLKSNANYAAWKQAVENQLMITGAIGIVDGSEEEPYVLGCFLYHLGTMDVSTAHSGHFLQHHGLIDTQT
jgi:hypothetical protein